MSLRRVLVALLAGLAAYALLVYLGGILAARGTPAGYFEYFGRERQTVAMGLWATLTFALPMLAAAVLLGAVAARATRAWHGWPLAGLVVGLLGAAGYYQFMLPLASWPEATAQSVLLQIQSIYFANPWHLPSSCAPWVGLAVGIWLVRRQRLQRGQQADA